ncbi:tRNA pseudouridine(38-40) synthase TruA [Pseudoteredinibacter isoporae]|nr:tRNA pseudouridine(38-40) synthase TruA [Pseudoteredinibacter isoporae]NHO88873.1 tRNA pseudouridine(38-40) synthase TruA [Pseudoteredinibacter isoporae]NIB24419.1 tRNA pseudouridine(38-40) synthase TruA [Pseudoteredinibacter isoporae]
MARPYKTNGEILSGESLPEGIYRYGAVVEYNGASYRGFQQQKHDPQTVQAELQKALSAVAAEPVSLVCAGRTDAGVHATSQVIHFDSRAVRPSKAWVQGVNTAMARDIRVRWAAEMPAQFHARFSAKARSYRYLISDQAVSPGLLRDQITWSKFPLDLEKMQHAAGFLMGEHDFSSFRAAQCQAKNPVREIQRIQFYRLHGGLIVMEIRANAFLHHMVRNIVGVLMAVGSGQKQVSWVADVLEARNRSAASVTAPAAGLYFVAAHYPEAFAIPDISRGPMLLPDDLSLAGEAVQFDNDHSPPFKEPGV